MGLPRRGAPTIRQWLAMLLAAFIVPTGVAVVALFLHSYGPERTAIERAYLDVSKALTLAVDRELSAARAALEALATSPSLDARDLRGFHAQAEAVLQSRPGNMLVLTSPDLRQVINTARPYGAALPMHGDPEGIRQVFATGRARVSDLYAGRVIHRLLSSVDVPVVRDGRVRYVLSMQYFSERLGLVLAHQHAPAGATVTIYDGKARVVWSSRGGAAAVGRRADSALTAGFAMGPQGTIDGVGPDGTGLVTVFSRSSLSGWKTAISLQRRVLDASLWSALEWIVIGGCGLLVLGGALVALIGRQIETAVRGLVRPAVALGHGEQVVLPPLPLDEAVDVGRALVQAAALLRERTLERDEAERAERSLREAKRAVERSEAFLRGIFEESPDGIVLVGPECRVTRANVRAERMFDYPAGALEGLPLDTLLVETGPAPASVCARLGAAPARSGMAGSAHLRGVRRDGDTFPADAMANLLPERALMIVTVRDVSVAWAQEEALRHALEDKNTLLKELYHRVKNNLQLIVSLFNLQARALKDGRARRALLEAADRVRAMSLVHERLYQSRNLGTIRLDDYMRELCDQLANAASARQRGIVLSLDVAPVEVGLDTAVPLGLLLNELVANSLKHAFPGQRRGTIRVTLAPLADAPAAGDGLDLKLTVQDDGIGLPPEAERTSPQTLGLKLVVALSAQLHARLALEHCGGACISLVFQVGRESESDASRLTGAPSGGSVAGAGETVPT